jgi:5-methylcytosine-specific restriction enzyme A
MISAGDTVYVWRADGGVKGSGGVVARGVVAGEPISMAEPSQYWYEEPNDEEVLKVPITVSEQRVDGSYLNRLDLKDHEVLQSLRIHSIRKNTNYLLTKEQAEALQELWAAAGPAEIVYFPHWNQRSVIESMRATVKILKLQVVYEYLFHGNTHRWIDRETLGLDVEYSRGYQSMGILHFIGVKDKYKAIFTDTTILDAIESVKQQEKTELLLAYLNSLQRKAVELGSMVIETEGLSNSGEETDDDTEYPEGREAFRIHRIRERDPKVVREAKKAFLNKHGSLYCEACETDFEKVYGERGSGYIEAHHTKPVSQMTEDEATKVEDIAMLCANCHRMIHRKPMISVNELRVLVAHARER